MDNLDPAAPDYIGEIGNGLIRRWSTAADVEKIALLMGTVHRDPDDPLPNPGPMAEVRLMMGGTFHYMTPNDAAVVEDTLAEGRPLVACTYFWRHAWSYAGITFGVTRPEMVVTLPAYRRRGLVRAIFEMIHARSAAEGHLLLAITGIAYFYRQFGYDYALDLDGGRVLSVSSLSDLDAEHSESSCSLRHATLDDIPSINAIYNQRRSSSLVWHEAPDAMWRFEIDLWKQPAFIDQEITQNGMKGRFWMVLDAQQNVQGYTWLPTRRWGRRIVIHELEFASGANIPLLAPALLRRLQMHGLSIPTLKEDTPPFEEIAFWLSRSHPIYDLLGDSPAPRVDPHYAWYIRIPDPAAFLRKISPVLETRIAGSTLAGFSGSPKIDLYREGLQLHIEQGRIVTIESIADTLNEDDETRVLACPPLNFPQLVLGYRGLDELLAIFPDVWVKDGQHSLIDTLFPKHHSIVEPLG